MEKLISFIAAALLAGCATATPIPVSERGNFLTYEHGIAKPVVEKVYQDAAARCEAKGLVAMQTSTNCPFRCVTNFECVKK